jgi:hypothetical protein
MPLLYLIAIVLPFALDNVNEFAEHLPGSLKSKLETLSSRYQNWSAGPRPLEARYTALVMFTEESLPSIIGNACEQRDLVRHLLPRLADFGSSMVVIDLSFGRDSCPESSPESTELIRALETTKDRVPIVIGQASKRLDDLEEDEAATLRKHGMLSNGLLLRPLINLSDSSKPRVHVGLLQINADVRRIPLEWPAYVEQNQMLIDLGTKPSLALETARTYRQGFPDGTRELDRLVSSGLHPFTHLLSIRKQIIISAGDLLCGTGFELGGKAVCNGAAAEQRARAQVQGKIAVVGWNKVTKDMWKTPVGSLPGVAMQANFIESLLDSRALKPISYWWQVAISLLWFALIEITFLFWPERALITAPLIMLTVAFVIYYVAVVNLGLYLALLPPSVVALLLRFWHRWFERQREQRKEKSDKNNGRPTGVDPKTAETQTETSELGLSH